VKEAGSDPSRESETDSDSQEGGSATPPQEGGSSAAAKSVDTAPLEVSGGGAEQYRVEGGDNSIQEFGEEGDEGELEEAAAVLHDYLVARAEEDWPAACDVLAGTVTDQLETLASRSDALDGQGCAKILEALTPPLPAAVRRESTIVDAGSLRHEGERAFLIFRGAGGDVYAIVMEQESGSWKVGALATTPIS